MRSISAGWRSATAVIAVLAVMAVIAGTVIPFGGGAGAAERSPRLPVRAPAVTAVPVTPPATGKPAAVPATPTRPATPATVQGRPATVRAEPAAGRPDRSALSLDAADALARPLAPAPAAAATPAPRAALEATGAALLPAAPQAATAGTYTLSPAVYRFLSTALHVPLAAATLHGSLSGSTLTVTAGPIGALPLPSGTATPSFGPVTIAVDLARKTLTLTATVTVATGAAGPSGTLTVTIGNPGTATLTGTAGFAGTLTVSGVPFIGASTASLTGTLGHSDGTLTFSLSGTTEAAVSVAGGAVVIRRGAAVTVAKSGPFTVKGTADIGTPGGATFAVAVDGSLTNRTTWSLAVSAAGSSPAPWIPVPAIPTLSVTPDFSGAIADKAGTVGFTLTAGAVAAPAAGPLLSWEPDSASANPVMAVTSLQVSNVAPAAAAAAYPCAADVADGQVWIGAGGSLSYAPAGLSLAADACVDVTSRHFTIRTTVTGSPSSGLFGGSTVHVTGASMTATYDGTKFLLTGSADLSVDKTGSSGAFTASLGLEFGSDGTVIGAATVASAGALADVDAVSSPAPGQELVVYVASKEVKSFNPGTYSLPGPGFPGSVPLQAGVTIAFQGTVPSQIAGAFSSLKIPWPDPAPKVFLEASLTSGGFMMNVAVTFGTADAGLQLMKSNGTALYFDDVDFGLAVGETTKFSLSGDSYLELPPLLPGGDGSQVGLSIQGSLEADGTVNLNLHTVTTWTGAFGVSGLTAATLGVTAGFDPDTLTPTFGLSADNITLPAAWSDAIGLTPGAAVTIDASLDPENPLLNLSITAPPPVPGQAARPALYPLAVAYGGVARGLQVNPGVLDSLQVASAQLYLAPDGGTTPGNDTLQPGINVAFAATIAGVGVNVTGSVQVSPTPSLSVDVATDGPLTLGQLTVGQTHFYLDAAATTPLPTLSLGFTGSVSDTASYDSDATYSFTADVGLALGRTDLNGATINLTMKAGVLPGYLALSGQLAGSVTQSGGQVTFTANGRGDFIFDNPNGSAGELGGVTFSVNQSTDGFDWGSSASIASIVQFFKSAADGTDTTVQILQHLGLTPYQILNALGLGGVSGPVVLNDLQTFFGVFSTTYQYIWVAPTWYDPDFLVVGVADSSQDPGHRVIDWQQLIPHYEQQWAFLPASVSGSYEIVNRNSGQCLTIPGGEGSAEAAAKGTATVQEPCANLTTQMWRLGTGTPQQGPRFTIRNVDSGLYLDVTGASTAEGAQLDQWTYNSAPSTNQYFWLTNGTN